MSKECGVKIEADNSNKNVAKVYMKNIYNYSIQTRNRMIMAITQYQVKDVGCKIIKQMIFVSITWVGKFWWLSPTMVVKRGCPNIKSLTETLRMIMKCRFWTVVNFAFQHITVVCNLFSSFMLNVSVFTEIFHILQYICP